MRTVSDKTEFSLHFITLKDPFDLSNLPQDLSAFCTNSETDEPITISFRCDDEEFVRKILVLSYKDNGILNPIEKYSTDGTYGKSGGVELLSEYILSNFITDTYDEEYRGQTWIDENGKEIITDSLGRLIVDWVSTDYIPPLQAKEGSQFVINGLTYKYNGYSWIDNNENYIVRDSSGNLVVNGRTTDFYPDRLDYYENEFTFNNLKYKKVYVNNSTLAPDFRNLIPQRKYPDFHDGGDLFGNKRFQYNINQTNLKKWIDNYQIPEFVFEILTPDQKMILSERLSNHIQWSWKSILKNIFNQEFEEIKTSEKVVRDTWGSDLYSSLGGDGEEDIYLSDGVSIRPDGSLTDD